VIADIGRKMDLTCILASHDPNDLLPWADELVILKDGAVIQQGKPKVVYNRPAEEYAGALLGKYNLLNAAMANAFGVPAVAKGKHIFLRPEHFNISKENGFGVCTKVSKVLFHGNYMEITVAIQDRAVLIYTNEDIYKEGDEVYVSIANQGHFWSV
jgi:ABC-type Fe3+/spermidine/putrescine transport system ATPase subunit